MVLTPKGYIESQKEEEVQGEEEILDKEVEYPDVGELLTIRKILNATRSPDDTNQ